MKMNIRFKFVLREVSMQSKSFIEIHARDFRARGLGALFGLGVLVMLSGAGCQHRAAVAPPAPAAERLITIGGAVTEIVFALGHGDEVVGVDTSSVFPPQAKLLPQVGYQRTLAAEGVLALRPTRLLAAEEAGPPAALAQLRSAGLAVEIIPSPSTLDGCRQKIEKLAALLGKRERGAQLIARLNEEVAQARTQPTDPRQRVLFLYTRGAGTLLIAGSETSADSMIQLAGAQNAAAAVRGHKPLAAEALLGMRPDVLLLTSRSLESFGGVQAIYQLPGLAALPSAQRPRIITQDDLLLLGFGPRTGQAIRELRAKLDQTVGEVPPATQAPATAQPVMAAAGPK